MTDRNNPAFARFVAPAALALFAILFFAVLLGSGSGDDKPKADSGAKRTAKKSKPKKTKTSAAPTTGKATYTVKTGDTLGGIADKNGVTVEQIQELNPDLDPQSLVSGQKIKLRE